MRQKLWLAIGLAILLGVAGTSFAKPRPKPQLINKTNYLSIKATQDTVFFDNFDGDSLKWDSMDIAVQKPYWHIDTYSPVGAYSGHHWWCGTNDFASSWTSSPGYGCGWVQMLYSPDFDLSTVTSDSIQLNFYHYYNVEPPAGGDWDCVNLWASTDGGATWFVLYPDTLFSEGGGMAAYNLHDSYAWKYTGMVPDSDPIPGWGGSNDGWKHVYFDLSAYKGGTLKLRFAVASDPLTADEDGGPFHGAWYMDNIAIDTVSNGGTKDNIFFDDAELGNIGWTAGSKTPVYHWHKTTYRANSAPYSWYSGDEGTKLYTWGQSDAIVSPYIDLTEVRNTEPCYVDFAIWADVPDDGPGADDPLDNWVVDVSEDSGKTWKGITSYVYLDASKTWTTHTSTNGVLDLGNWIGKVIKIRIGFSSDGDTWYGEGLYVDDFIITGKTREALPPASTILLVDNDGNAVDVANNSWTKYLESSLADLGYHYGLATIGSNKLMYSGYLEQFPAVIWNLGSNYEGKMGPEVKALSVNDQALIMSYLDNGGKLWMTAQTYMGLSSSDTTVHPNLWTDYLHLASENGWYNNACYTGTGVASDPIGDGLYDSLIYDPLNGGGMIWTGPIYGFSLTPDTTDANLVKFISTDDSSAIGLRYWDGTPSGYKYAFTSFPFEAVSSQIKRDTLASRIIQWLIPGTPEYTPPAVPTGLTVVQDYDSVVCSWAANTEPDLAGYNVYRSLQVSLPVWIKLGTTSSNTFVDTSIVPGDIYHYAVTAFDDKLPPNESAYSPWIYLQVAAWKAGVDGEPLGKTPGTYGLAQNNPNPFKGTTSIQFALPAQSRVKLAVYNITGQQVRVLVDGNVNAGYHSVNWNGKDQNGLTAANGIYFYRMEASDGSGQKFSQTKRLNLVR